MSDAAHAAAMHVARAQAPGALERAMEAAWPQMAPPGLDGETRRHILLHLAQAVRRIQAPYLADAKAYLEDSRRAFKSKQVERAREILELLSEQ